MPYAVIPIIAAVILLLHHVTFTGASRTSKVVLLALVGTSLLIWRSYPQYSLAATLIQVGASIYMLVYLKVGET